MASAISKQPPLPILPAYRPVAFEMFFDTLTSASRGENAVIRVYKDGVELTDRPIRQKSLRNETSPLSPLDTRWYFEIDIQTDCQETLAPYVSLPSGFVNPATRFVSNADMFGVYYITVTYEIIDLTTGLLEDSGIDQETSEEFTVFSASKGNLETMFLDDYYGSFAAQDGKFLTKSSRAIKLCKEDSTFLSLIVAPDMPPFPLGLNALRVILYDSSSNALSVSVSAFSFVVTDSIEITINAGTEALSNGFWLPAIPNFADPALSYYTVEVGEAEFITQVFVPQTETFRYNLTGSCCPAKSLRLYWLNRLGGVDSFTFDDAKDLRETTTSERGKQALGWVIGGTSPHKTSSEGLFKYNSQSIQQYLVTTGFLTNKEALWLSELLSSSKVYIDIDNTFTLVACTVQDTTQSITRNDGKIKYSLVLTLSNNPINHRL